MSGFLRSSLCAAASAAEATMRARPSPVCTIAADRRASVCNVVVGGAIMRLNRLGSAASNDAMHDRVAETAPSAEPARAASPHSHCTEWPD